MAFNFFGGGKKEIPKTVPCLIEELPQPVSTVMGAFPAKKMSVLGSHANNPTEFGGTDEWYTPPFCVNMVKEVLGGIDLDPASSEKANSRIGATRYFSEQNSGLTQSWETPTEVDGVTRPSRVWLNPPNSMMTAFTKKIIGEVDKGHVESMIVVINTRCDTDWFFKLFSRFGGYFTQGRIAFEKHNKITGELIPSPGGGGAPTGQIFFYHGPDPEKFVEVFSRFRGYYVAPKHVRVSSSTKPWK